MKSKLFTRIFCVATMVFSYNIVSALADNVVCVFPENGSIGVLPSENKMTVTYDQAVDLKNKTVLLNNSEEGIDEITSEEEKLIIKFKQLNQGTRYKVSVNDELGGNDITTFFTTDIVTSNYIAKYESGNLNELYGNKVSNGTVNVSEESFEFTSSCDGVCRVYFSDKDINPDTAKKIIISLTSVETVNMKLYFSHSGGHKKFSKDKCFDFSVKGGETEEIVINATENAEWIETVKQFMIEQSDELENTIKINYFYVMEDIETDTNIGSFGIYSGYNSSEEELITDKLLEAGTVTVALSAIQSKRETGAFLVAVYFKDGKMVDGKCKYISLADKQTAEPAELEFETDGSGYVKAFLRHSMTDIRPIIPHLSTQINN